MSVLYTWNVNGLRACARHGFAQWLAKQRADVVALQEIKVRPEQLELALRAPKGYQAFWHPGEKPGYSGVAVFCKEEPLEVRYGLGEPEFDREGRVLTVEFKDFTLVNAYFPNSQRDHARLPFKLRFCERFTKLARHERARGKTVLFCADWNIAPTAVDLKNPQSNQKTAGFLPEERAWMAEFLSQGYADAFRHFTPDPGHYTWWSYRPGVREKNVGWRIDYFLVDQDSTDRLHSCTHQNDVYGSDHCPVRLQLRK